MGAATRSTITARSARGPGVSRATVQRVLQHGKRHRAAVQRHVNFEARQLAPGVLRVQVLADGMGRFHQAQTGTHGAQPMVDRLGVGAVHEDGQQALANELHVPRAKQVNCIAGTAIEFFDKLCQLDAAELFSHGGVVGNVHEQHGGMLEALVTRAAVARGPALAEFLGQALLIELGQVVLLVLQRGLDSSAHGHCLQRGLHDALVQLRGRGLAQLARAEGFGDVVVRAGGHSDAHVGTLLQ